MKMRKLLSGLALGLALAAPSLATPDLFALKVRRAETVSQGTLEHAVILIENGKIVTIGQDLEIERGIPIIDRTDLVVTPGFVDCYSRMGIYGSGPSGTYPQLQAVTELYPKQDIYGELAAEGVTTLGLYPPGNGIAGQAVAIRTWESSTDAMVLDDSAYVKGVVGSNSSSRRMIESAFEKVDKHHESVEKAREKWEKEMEKWEKDNKKKDKDEREPEPDPFTAPTPDPDAKAMMDVLDGELSVMFGIRKAGDYLHLLDFIGEREFEFSLRVPLRNDIDLYEVAEELGEAGRRVVMEPELTLMAWTMRERNIPAELARAGAEIIFIPSNDNLSAVKGWRNDVGHLIKNGLDRQAALRAMTLAPAMELDLDERLGSLDAGKDANLLFFDGDPFQPTTNLISVMVEGEFLETEDVR